MPLAQKGSTVLIRGLSRNALQTSMQRRSIWNQTIAFHSPLQNSMTATESLLQETPQIYTQRLITAKGFLAHLQTSANAIAYSKVPRIRSTTQDYICLRRTRTEGMARHKPLLSFRDFHTPLQRSKIIQETPQRYNTLPGIRGSISRGFHVQWRPRPTVPKTSWTRAGPKGIRGFISTRFFNVHLQISSSVNKSSRMRAQAKDIRTARVIASVVLFRCVRKQCPRSLCYLHR